MKPIELNWIEEYTNGLIYLFLGGSFKQELNSEVITFSTRLTPLFKKSLTNQAGYFLETITEKRMLTNALFDIIAPNSKVECDLIMLLSLK